MRRGPLVAIACASLGCASVQRAELAAVPADVKAAAAEPRPIDTQRSRFDVSASDSVTGAHRLHFERWRGTFAPGALPRLTLDFEAASIVAESGWVTDVVRSDLLEVWRFPAIHFDGNLEPSGPESCVFVGNVTLHGVTRAIRFHGKTKTESGQTTLEASFDMSRTAFDIRRHDRWDSFIKDDFRIDLSLVTGP